MRVKIITLLTIWPALLVLLVPACGGSNPASQPAKPVANITAPASNTNLAVGQEVLITFNAADVNGIGQVELTVDGQPVMVEAVEPPVNSYTASHRWQAQTPGSHVIELRAFNVDGVASDPVQVFVMVTGQAVADAPTPTSPPTPGLPTATFTPLPTLPVPTFTPAPQTDAGANEAMVTAVVRLNVRMGPSTDYPVIGQLALNESAKITGRDEFSTWWQIEYASESGDRGWVAAGSEFSTAANTGDVPVVQAPPLESVATPTSPPPSPTPEQLKPTIFSFTADRYTIAPGENVVLRWDLANAQAAYLRYSGTEEGVAAPGSKTVSPAEDTTYTLVARNQAGETIAELTIKVGDALATPVPVLRDGKMRIANGQYIDFDQGIVHAQPNADVDFFWDGPAQKFFPQSGASGTLLSKAYGDISFEDCRTADYTKPISGVDGSSAVMGCYLTNQGRYGKFLISEWDIAANLTVEWLTWQTP